MNLLRIYLIAVLFLTFGVVTNSQEKPEPILIGEVGNYPCDGFRGYIDVFLAELRENPGWHGTVVNTGRVEGQIWAVVREEMIRNHVIYRGFDSSRISYSRSVSDEFRTQFFGSPASKEMQFQASKNYVLSPVTAPVVIKDYDFDDLCPPLIYNDLFATIMEQNTKIRATILVRGRTLQEARKRKKKLSNYLINTRKIVPQRIRFLIAEKPSFEYGMDPYLEYRFIP